MKRTPSFMLALVILFSARFSISALAAGDGNMDGGSGGMGGGSGTCYWNGGDDGVRVTVITKEGKQVRAPIDYSNINTSRIEKHFGKVNKLSYANGAALSPNDDSYIAHSPAMTMPRIISTSAIKASIEKIKAYFCSDGAAQMIASDVGIDAETLINGEYKLLIEPIAYFHFNGTFFAMTATEAAIYNKLSNGALRASMVSLTSKNLPLSMYLQVPDIGFPAYSGSKTTPQTD